MRSEQQLFDLLLKTAIEDERIRAVYISGSRANPNALKDIFQDYDIVYIVKETAPFRDDKSWIDRFGEKLYMQYPEDSAYYPADIENCYGWLIQFRDGNRLDLHVCTLQHELKSLSDDNMYKILLDKDNCLPIPEKSSDEAHWVKRPTDKQFYCTCNEFWWNLNNVAKGLWRDEIPYVMDILNFCVRPMLIRLLEWKIGIKTDFTVSAGKSGKYMYRWLSPKTWEQFLKTYPSSEINEIWESVFYMCDLVDEAANNISKTFSFKYNQEEANNSRSYLKHVKNLPKEATEIYPFVD